MKLEKLRAGRYFIIANSVILLVGVVVIFVGGRINKSAIEFGSLLVNVGSEVVAVAVIFFLARILLIDTEEEILERLKEITDKIEPQSTVNFKTIREIRQDESVIEFFGQSHDLFLGGVALRATVQRHKAILSSQINKGARLRFLLLDPKSPDIEFIAKTWEVQPDHTQAYIYNTMKELASLQTQAIASRTGSVEIRLMAQEPPFSFSIRNPTWENGVFQGGLRAYSLSAATRPEWILYPSDRWYKILIDSCENLWKVSRPWPDIFKAGVVVSRYLSNEDRVEILIITARTTPRTWVFPVGTVDPGETFQETAARECMEESGYIVEVGSVIKVIDLEKRNTTQRFIFFDAKVTGEVSVYEMDRDRKWVLPSELTQYVAEVFHPVAIAAKDYFDKLFPEDNLML